MNKKGQHLVSVIEIVIFILHGRSPDMLTSSTKFAQVCQAAIVNVIYEIVAVLISEVCIGW